MFKRRKKLLEARRDAMDAYKRAMTNLASFQKIDQSTKGYVYIRQHHERCMEIINAYYWDAITQRSIKEIGADIGVILAVNELWAHMYNFGVSIMETGAEKITSSTHLY